MGTWDVLLISSSTATVDGEVAVELYGKTRDHKSITILVYGVEAYLYLVDPKPGQEDELANDPGVKEVSHRRLMYRTEMHDTLKV
ncbi:MAG: DNA polymerase II, partial [Candidatus Methanomethylophilaceae archaeon]|nr:DNA polymerase II [Candidatus Methanomethylophilaceae archaeon]